MPSGEKAQKNTLVEVRAALKETDGVVRPAAKILNVSKQSLMSRIKRSKELSAYAKQLHTNKRARLTRRHHLWLKYYLDASNESFLNKRLAAQRAGYADSQRTLTTIGCRNFVRYEETIKVWFDKVGLSENELRAELVELRNAKETKFFTYPIKDEKGDVIDIFIKTIEVVPLELRRRVLDMALKVRGMNAPEVHKHEVNELAELLAAVSGATRGLPNKTQEKIE